MAKRDGRVVTAKHGVSRRRVAGLVVLSVILGVGIGFMGAGFVRSTRTEINNSAPVVIRERPIFSLGRLTEMSDNDLAKVDLGLMNLMCGDLLPRSGRSTVAESMKELERLTDAVRRETSRNQHRWLENPAEFQNSEAYFKTAFLLTVLGQDFGARYNPKKIETPSAQSLNNMSFYDDADDIFISGLLGETHLGTCTSMPVLAVAVGRRLGYPLKLVGAKAHLFFRWDDGTTRMNFEYTNGVACHPDEHYRKWPFPISDSEVKAGWYLSSMTPAQELSVFLALRGEVLKYHRNFAGALKALIEADNLWPGHPDHGMALSNAASQRFAEMGVAQNPLSGYQAVHSNIPRDPLREVKEMNALNESRMRSGFSNPSETSSFDSGFSGSGQNVPFGESAQQPFSAPLPFIDRK